MEEHSSFEIIFFTVLGILFYIYKYYEKQNEKRITEDLKKFALKNDYIFQDNSSELKTKLNFCGIFDKEDNIVEIKNILIKKEEHINIYWFDFIVTIDTGEGKRINKSSYVAIECENMLLPSFILFKNSILTAFLGKNLKKQNICFNNDKLFSQKFLVYGDSEEDIRNFFTESIRKSFVYELSKNIYGIYGNNKILFLEQKKQIASISDRLKLERAAENMFNHMYSEQIKNNESSQTNKLE